MPRRYLIAHSAPASESRMKHALVSELDRPSVDEIIKSQDDKLQEIKRSVFSSVLGPQKLMAGQPILMSGIIEAPAPAHMISTHYNDHEQAVIGGEQHHTEADVDFSKAEDFLQLETPIDARKDHNMLRLACTIPRKTFMGRLLRRYPINKKRLAFIQRNPSASKPLEVVSNMLASLKGGENKEISISCQVCGQRFNRQHQFQRHILTHPDPDNKKFLCQICGKRFNRADHLNRHAILHGDIKVQKCLLCGEEFDRASHLDRHRRKLHPPAGQAPAQTPPLTPQMKSPLVIEGGSLSPTLSSPSATVDSQGSGNNLHLLAAVATPDGGCEVMDPLMERGEGHLMVQGQLVAVDMEALTEQERQELEPDRPFACEVCERKFIRATHLRRHMRIHTGEKPFACHICGRRYARGDYLRAHIHAHRRDKVHKCKHCGEVFHDLTRFADHCRIRHKDVDDEFGNPKPPPDNSPPPPNMRMETTLTVEPAQEITMIQTVDSPTATITPSFPITLVNIPDSQDPAPDHFTVHPNPAQLPTPSQTPMTSPELQLVQLQSLAGQTAPQVLMQNGQMHIPDTGHEITVLSQPKAYVDPVAHYMMSNGNSNSSHMPTFPTPSASPLINQGLPHSNS